jgi:hypothetical protein
MERVPFTRLSQRTADPAARLHAITALGLFHTVRDELCLDCCEPLLNVDELLVWLLWPKLRTLVLYNPDVGGARFWPCLGRLRSLETLVLTRSDGLEEADVKAKWKVHRVGYKIILNG